MLELFVKSKIRQRIILLFIYNPNREFYLSEIAEKIGTSAGTAQRELNKLLHASLINFKKRAGLNLYSLNRKYSLLKEVESIIKKTLGAEVELKKELSKIKAITFAFLFGSYVKGGFKSDSDLDLFIVGEAEEEDIHKAVRKVENIIGREINYHIADSREFFEKLKTKYFYKEIVRNHIMLIGDENEFRRLAEKFA